MWYEYVYQIPGCGMNVSTKSNDVVWLCLPNLMMRYECVYQVLWCNNNNCISNVPSASRPHVWGSKHYTWNNNTQFNNALHITLPLPLCCIHTCTPTRTISQPLPPPSRPPPIISQPIKTSAAKWRAWCGQNVSTKSCDVVWMHLPNPGMWYECVHQIMGCGMKVSTKSWDIVWRCLPNPGMWYECLPNPVVWYECVYQIPCCDVVWMCLPNPVMGHECVYQILRCNVNVSTKSHDDVVMWYECVYQTLWRDMNVSTKSHGGVWTCLPNPVMRCECVYQILSCGMNVSTKSCHVECDSCWAGTGPVSVNMPDPIWKRVGYGQLWPLQPMCSQNQAKYARSHFLHRFSSVFPKTAWMMLHRTNLDPIWMVWSDVFGLEARWCAGIIGPSFWQDTSVWPPPPPPWSLQLLWSASVLYVYKLYLYSLSEFLLMLCIAAVKCFQLQ